MFIVNNDMSICVTRGDIIALSLSADDNGSAYTFNTGDLVRIKVFGKKDCNTVFLKKDFPVTSQTNSVDIFLSGEETKIGSIINKPTEYWYEVELNPDTYPKTILGYDEDGPKIFKLFPEGADTNDQ